MYSDLKADHVWLIGSGARGDGDPGSDIDILLISDNDSTSELKHKLEDIYRPKTNFDICFYTPPGIEAVIKGGSLFGWHVKKEGIALYDKNNWLRLCLNKIPPYNNHLNDLNLLLKLSQDIFDSLYESSLSLEYDAGVISTSIRNTCIVMTDFFGSTDFSPKSYLRLNIIAPTELNIPLTDFEYNLLLGYRRESERGITFNAPNAPIDQSSLFDIAERVISWQINCIEFMSERSKS
ncbi:MAG TPA: hypothetical protein DDY22_15560 [Geobacter sp.]|nr:hypothetical protein [Geobacter sp.]